MNLPDGMQEMKELEETTNRLAKFCHKELTEAIVKAMRDTGLEKNMTVHTFAMNMLLLELDFVNKFAAYGKYMINKTMYMTMQPQIRNKIMNDPEFNKMIDREYDKLLDDINKHDKPEKD